LLTYTSNGNSEFPNTTVIEARVITNNDIASYLQSAETSLLVQPKCSCRERIIWIG